MKRGPDGWTVEMRIPWGILNYPNGKKSVTMGLNFTRLCSNDKLDEVAPGLPQCILRCVLGRVKVQRGSVHFDPV